MRTISDVTDEYPATNPPYRPTMAEQVRVLEQELQQYRTNLNIAASARRSAEAKATELSEQKKVRIGLTTGQA